MGELGIKFRLQERERWEKGVYRFVLVSHYPTLIDSKLHLFPEAEPGFVMTVIGKWFFCPYLDPWACCSTFSPCRVEEEKWYRSLVSNWCPANVKPSHPLHFSFLSFFQGNWKGYSKSLIETKTLSDSLSLPKNTVKAIPAHIYECINVLVCLRCLYACSPEYILEYLKVQLPADAHFAEAPLGLFFSCAGTWIWVRKRKISFPEVKVVRGILPLKHVAVTLQVLKVFFTWFHFILC